MRHLGSWLARVGVGFVRACVVTVVSLLVPAVWAAAVALGIWWGAGNPWSWVAPFVLVCVGTLALSRPVCRMVRFLVARWTATVIPSGYRQTPQVTQLSTGYWWNGFSYERTSRDALLDQRWRVRWQDPANWRDLRFTAVAPLTAGVVASLPPAGVAAAALGLSQPAPSARLVGAFGLVVAFVSAPYAWRFVEPVAVRFLRPTPAMALADRVDELTAQRADATVAQAAEIRRIERDLHDGAQARLVSLGLSLATAEKLMETDPVQARALMREARAGATASLTELRDLVRGINPPVLNDRGLVDAVRALALDSPLEADVSADLRLRLDPPIESALYFGVAELLTNAVKHAQATRARISISRDTTTIVIDVEDDGRGGARERADGGLAGLRRRLAVFDGTVEITSPAGGPTLVRMMVPCESL
ncbi:sensor histidine kinase [Micromonospora parathelypteridis]|uniref:histidine kinase n=1 Tax=Micromonospora parathelypteridis TaxID=1839617 RepID=A0A840VWA2_9ACTN|nr:histidine kinase [Micromonospora parathelypteridis]MBB5481562.1 signal transduction histidine kinase [Micromonospora parathelypteridis]GGO29267.1 histidine kinase [Micromonospora parathelypteridis]